MDPADAVRPAEARDFDAVHALLHELGRPAVADKTRVVLEGMYLNRLARPTTLDRVAEVDGEVVGVCNMELRDRVSWTRPELFVPDLIVTRAHRGEGLGRALMEEALRLARANRCYRVVLDSGHERDAAHGLYDSLGFEDAGVFFARRLATGEDQPDP